MTRARILAATLFGALAACSGPRATASAQIDDKQSFDVIQRGRYLTVLGDCQACHTAEGQKPFAGGRPVETPFGTLLSPNITPDRETGIGAWSDAEFANTLVAGTGRGGEHIYPAMPYTYYTKVRPEDVAAIRAYLNTLEPVRNAVKSNQLPFPFNVRASLTGWDALFFQRGTFQPVTGKSDEWNRGAYLVQGLGHCGACHTEKNALGGDETGRALRGGVLQGWYAPDITNDERRGLGTWSVGDIVAYLKTGHNRVAAASGPMAEEVSYSSSRMEPSDLKAIAVYLKDQGGAAQNAKPVAADDHAMQAGGAIYKDNCAACHQDSGAGIAGLFPALKGAPAIQSEKPTSLIRVVLQGAQSVATDPAPTGAAMPGLGWKLDDAQVAAVVTYVRNTWGNAASAASADDVRSQRHDLSARTQ